MNHNIIRVLLNCGIVPFLTFQHTKKYNDKEEIPPKVITDEHIKSFSTLPEKKMNYPKDLLNRESTELTVFLSIITWIGYCCLIRLVNPTQYNTFNVFSMALAFAFRGCSCLPLMSWLADRNSKIMLVVAEISVLLINVYSGFVDIQMMLGEACIVLGMVTYMQIELFRARFAESEATKEEASGLTKNFC